MNQQNVEKINQNNNQKFFFQKFSVFLSQQTLQQKKNKEKILLLKMLKSQMKLQNHKMKKNPFKIIAKQFDNLIKAIEHKDVKEFHTLLLRMYYLFLPSEPINDFGDSVLRVCTRTYDKEIISEFISWWFANQSNFSAISLPGVWRNRVEDTPLHVLCARLDGNAIDFLEFYINEIPGIDIKAKNTMNSLV